ncbi:hypothetical protein FB563_7640 [Streptomyces puniciscabiei]|uniref:Uncharacterized protein n=1 Tax=Streptomyces puniciscabiei TaxID=164348 RepID=A0A542SZQ5_9ACTN|nr:hypothetical protein [Streptomyces puniciscabiei]TQK79787.1 hypothetical protein FB563_7640 [Streptomyces puniciscabiei]
MDLDTVADELYGLRPEEFVAARDRRALDARKAGDQALAKEIGALRRPSLAAWAGNLLVRRQPEEVQPLLDLGESLRRAHRELDGPQLRKLVRRQSEVIGALGRQARRLAAEAGRPVGEAVQREVEETLHAVLADPEAAREWAAGRLVKPLSARFGFPEADEAVLDLRPAAPAAARAKSRDEGPPGGRGAERKRGEAHEREDELAHRRRLNEVRRAARDAERDLHAREAEAGAAGREAEEARDRLAEAEERVRELRARLRDAEEEQQRSRDDEREARDRARQADHAAREARRHAEAAAAEASAAEADRPAGPRAGRASPGLARRR